VIRQINVKGLPPKGTKAASPQSGLSPGADLCVSYRSGRGSGVFNDYKIKPGMLLTVSDRQQTQGLKTVHETQNAPVSIGFNLCHRVRCTIHAGRKQARTFERPPGGCVLSYLPQTRCIIETPPEKRILGVSVHFALDTFKGLFSHIPDGLEDILLPQKTLPHVYRQLRFSRQAADVLTQISGCPYTGEIRSVFLEAKALELVALTLFGMESDRGAAPGHRETEQIHQAYQILASRIDAPPTLSELSRATGINRNKLNLGFKRIYGGTVFSVLRDLRLCRARNLLQDTQTSLADIALSVGYSDQANFTTAFRQKFGKTPLAMRRNQTFHF